MHIESISLPARWWYALKPASWPKVLVSALFGQAVGAAAAGHLSPGALLFSVSWMIADVAFIVNVFPAQSAYEAVLHRSICWGTAALSATALSAGLGARQGAP